MNILPRAAPNVLALSAERSPHRLATGVLLVYLFLVMSRGVEGLAVAEGIETQRDLDAIGAIGIEVVQGFFLGRPLPPSHLSFQLPAFSRINNSC